MQVVFADTFAMLYIGVAWPSIRITFQLRRITFNYPMTQMPKSAMFGDLSGTALKH